MPEMTLGLDRLDFEVVLGKNGDNFDRYLVRMGEMEQSMRMAARVMLSGTHFSDARPMQRQARRSCCGSTPSTRLARKSRWVHA